MSLPRPVARLCAFGLSVVLAGCGAEVAGTAATVGKLQATQAEQAKAQQQKIQVDLGAALEAGKARTDAAGQ